MLNHPKHCSKYSLLCAWHYCYSCRFRLVCTVSNKRDTDRRKNSANKKKYAHIVQHGTTVFELCKSRRICRNNSGSAAAREGRGLLRAAIAGWGVTLPVGLSVLDALPSASRSDASLLPLKVDFIDWLRNFHQALPREKRRIIGGCWCQRTIRMANVS